MTIEIVDNEDGTFTASSDVDGEITVVDAGEELYSITASNLTQLSEDLYRISTYEYDTPGVGIVWDKVGDRKYETGLDTGVLYLPDGSGVAWNGLTSVIEHFDKTTSPVYYDGMKINDLVTLGDFSATLKAVTYPDEFEELEGLYPMKQGIFVGDQMPQSFGLCYRNQLGNDVEGDVVGYKIHILYNVVAIPTDKTYATISQDPSLVEFEWDLVAVPEEVPGFRPTAHIVINSIDVDPLLLAELEEILYGGYSAEARLIPMAELVTKIQEWFRVKIVDHGDGTWSAISDYDGFIHFFPNDLFNITNVNAVYLNDYTFVISDTAHQSDVPQIKIDEYPDGTWSATTDHDNLIFVTTEGLFEIRNANAAYLNDETYRISDTVDE
jgi:hypothetical protein